MAGFEVITYGRFSGDHRGAHCAISPDISSVRPINSGLEHIREFQLHLIRNRKLAVNTVKQRMAAVQFFFIKTLKRAYLQE